MRTIEELKAKHAAEVERLEKEIAIAGRAPVAPHRAQLTSSGLPTWLHYRAETLAAALEIMNAAPVVPFYSYKNGFTRMQPEAFATEKSGEVTGGPYAASLYVSQGEGFGPSVELRFFVLAGDEICAAHVAIGPEFQPSQAWSFGAHCNVVRGYRERIERRDWSANRLLSALADRAMRWGTGSDTSATYEYLFAADTVEGGAEHATAQITTIARDAHA